MYARSLIDQHAWKYTLCVTLMILNTVFGQLPFLRTNMTFPPPFPTPHPTRTHKVCVGGGGGGDQR
jgi:hypothetical protein